MLYKDLIELPPSQFKRAFSVDHQTFTAMVKVLVSYLVGAAREGVKITLCFGMSTLDFLFEQQFEALDFCLEAIYQPSYILCCGVYGDW